MADAAAIFAKFNGRLFSNVVMWSPPPGTDADAGDDDEDGKEDRKYVINTS